MRKYDSLYVLGILVAIAIAATIFVRIADTVFAIVLSLCVATWVHEIGHVLAGLAGGGRPLLMCAWPFEIVFGQNSVRFGYARLPGFALVQTRIAHHRLATMVMYAGGPLADLVMAGLAFHGYARITAVPGGAAGNNWALLFRIAGIVAAADALLALLPLDLHSAIASDGLVLRRLARGGPAVARLREFAAISLADIKGTRPRDWPVAPIAQALELRDAKADEANAYQLAYAHALDRGDIGAAREALARSVAIISTQRRTMGKRIFLEAAFFAALHQHDAGAAEQYLSEAMGRMGPLTPHHAVLRAEAAVSLAQGDFSAAVAKAKRALAVPSDPWDAGSIIAEHEWLEDILREAQAGLAAQGAKAEGPAS